MVVKSKTIEKIFGSSKSSSTNSAGVFTDVLVALHVISENDGHTFTAIPSDNSAIKLSAV